ncbi:DUF1801 domain-containing protein [Minwuia thermotolerans]|uniref:YdhG-like domain-containing protein n=1 Tax=Minwuia thermotolerans TaxID=2056226 RepID=A0A2M9G631_9PROT|nr:DUF1801 domain-containing protein [Minwuia thermotolerans]PJK31126.1 hypothetical protein CVT23_02505 [Minwuia thermotolerans]
MKVAPPFRDAAVQAVFDSYAEPAREGLLALRGLIFETAAATPGVGAVEETLKWGQPAYLTPETKSGSTLRLAPDKQGGFAIYAHCQTTIIPDFRDLFPEGFDYEGNRAIHFRDADSLPLERLRLLISSALTWRLRKRKPAARPQR